MPDKKEVGVDGDGEVSTKTSCKGDWRGGSSSVYEERQRHRSVVHDQINLLPETVHAESSLKKAAEETAPAFF